MSECSWESTAASREPNRDARTMRRCPMTCCGAGGMCGWCGSRAAAEPRGGEARRVAFLDGRRRALRPQILLDFKTAIAMLQGMMAYTPGPILQHPV